MCGRYILAQKIEVIAKRFNTAIPEGINYQPSYNISPGDRALVVVNDDVPVLSSFVFGLTPFWSKKAMCLFNARSEGSRNQDNNPTYSGAKDIINKPAFRKAIRSQRCLVPADAFIEGTSQDGLNCPFLIYLRDKVRPFSFAGIWDTWQNPETGAVISSFSIITTTANELILQLPHHRSPVILHPWQEAAWLNKQTPLSQITAMLKPYDAHLMNGYPIDSKIKSSKLKDRSLINPIGSRLMPDVNVIIADRIVKSGFGSRKIN